MRIMWNNKFLNWSLIKLFHILAQSAGAIEYADCISAEG